MHKRIIWDEQREIRDSEIRTRKAKRSGYNSVKINKSAAPETFLAGKHTKIQK